MDEILKEINEEVIAIIESARLLSNGDPNLFNAHIKYFCNSPVILKEVNRILKIMNQ